MMVRLFLLLFSLLIWCNLFARENLDSLEIILEKIPDTDKPAILNKIAKENLRLDLEKSCTYAQKALELAETSNDINETGVSLRVLGVVCYYKGDYSKAYDYFTKALHSYTISKNDFEKAKTFNNMGAMYGLIGDYDKSVKNHLDALKIFENLEDETGIAGTWNNLGIIYYYMDNIEISEQYFIKALNVFSKLNEPGKIADIKNNMANIYFGRSDYDNALSYYLDALKIAEEISDKWLSTALMNNISNTYIKMNSLKMAELFANKTIELAKSIDDIQSQISSKINLGDIYQQRGDYSTSINYALDALVEARNIENKYLLMEVYEFLKDVYKKNNNFIIALAYTDSSSILKEELFISEKQSAINNLQQQYEIEREINRLRAETEVQKHKLEKQHYYRNISIGGLIAAILIVILLLNRYRIQVNARIEREKNIKDLQEALDKVKLLSGLIPICSHCKKIRDDGGYWKQIESYIKEHSEAEFSHSICPECMKEHYKEYDLD